MREYDIYDYTRTISLSIIQWYCNFVTCLIFLSYLLSPCQLRYISLIYNFPSTVPACLSISWVQIIWLRLFKLPWTWPSRDESVNIVLYSTCKFFEVTLESQLCYIYEVSFGFWLLIDLQHLACFVARCLFPRLLSKNCVRVRHFFGLLRTSYTEISLAIRV